MSASPRVLLVSGEYPPAVGGVGDYTALLAAALRDQGVATSVATSGGVALPGECAVRRDVPGWGWRCWAALATIAREERADLIHIQYQAGAFDGRGAITLLPWRFARARRSPLPPMVVTFHDLRSPYLFPKAGPLRSLAIRGLARRAALVIATNGDDWAALRADAAARERLRLIPIGSNIPLPRAGEELVPVATRRAALGISPGRTVVAYFGLAGVSKGLDTLLEALAQCHEATPGRYHLLIVGGAASATDRARFDDGGDVRAAIARRGLNDLVTITGPLPADAVGSALGAADLAVLPYRDGASWRRGSLLAALTAGVPVITTTPAPGYAAEGRLPQLRDGENVLLVSPSDAGMLAVAIQRAGTDAGLRASLIAGGRALAAAFSWSAIAALHRECYQSVMRS